MPSCDVCLSVTFVYSVKTNKHIVAKLLGKPDDKVWGVSESEWVVYDDTVIFSNLPVYYAQSASVST